MRTLGHIRKVLKRAYYKRFEYNPATDLWLIYQILKMKEGLDYVDNIRVARIGDSFQEHRYQKQRDKGCCGSVDVEKRFIFSRYKIGCNYGH